METARLRLRALEPYDVETMLEWENDEELWKAGQTIAPYSRRSIENYILNYNPDIFAEKQLRLMIELKESGAAVGSVDLYDFDPVNRRSMIGYIIGRQFRGNGYAAEAIDGVADYCAGHLGIHQLAAIVAVDNLASRKTLENASFKTAGRLRSWLSRGGSFVDALFYQRLL